MFPAWKPTKQLNHIRILAKCNIWHLNCVINQWKLKAFPTDTVFWSRSCQCVQRAADRNWCYISSVCWFMFVKAACVEPTEALGFKTSLITVKLFWFLLFLLLFLSVIALVLVFQVLICVLGPFEALMSIFIKICWIQILIFSLCGTSLLFNFTKFCLQSFNVQVPVSGEYQSFSALIKVLF